MSKNLEAWRMNDKRENISMVWLLKFKLEGAVVGRNSAKNFQGQNILCPESQAWRILFCSIFNKKPLKDFKQELFSGLCLRKIYLAETVR